MVTGTLFIALRSCSSCWDYKWDCNAWSSCWYYTWESDACTSCWDFQMLAAVVGITNGIAMLGAVVWITHGKVTRAEVVGIAMLAQTVGMLMLSDLRTSCWDCNAFTSCGIFQVFAVRACCLRIKLSQAFPVHARVAAWRMQIRSFRADWISLTWWYRNLEMMVVGQTSGALLASGGPPCNTGILRGMRSSTRIDGGAHSCG